MVHLKKELLPNLWKLIPNPQGAEGNSPWPHTWDSHLQLFQRNPKCEVGTKVGGRNGLGSELSCASMLLFLWSSVVACPPPPPTATTKRELSSYSAAMEASSFCASKSYSKTLDLVHPVKIRLPKRRSSQHSCRRSGGGGGGVANFPAITCGSFPSNDDAADVTLQSDWRTFRARLVAAEQSSVLAANPPPLPAGDRWAHPLHTPEKGCLLIASPRLDGVHIFERTVVLLLTTSPTPTGVILNRPSLMSIKESKSTPLDSRGVFSDRPLLFGGPVEGGVFLVANNRQVGRSGVFEEVMDGVYYGGKESVGCAAEMVKRGVAGAEEFRFFDGCCGWEREQLREEVAGGCWRMVACGGGVVERCVGRAGMWEDVTGIVGQRIVW